MYIALQIHLHTPGKICKSIILSQLAQSSLVISELNEGQYRNLLVSFLPL